MQPATLRKLHSFSGLFPLGAYLLFHAYEHLAIRAGRDPAIARLGQTSNVALELMLVLLPLLVHAGLGLWLARHADFSPAYASPRFRRLQAGSGVLTALFLVWHVAGVWLPRALSGRSADAFGALSEQVASLPRAGLYALGASAACLHFAQGLSAVLIRNRPELSVALVRAVAALLGIFLWLTFVNELMAYATGAPLL